MRRVLCVAEKNDVAKGVAAILSKGQMVRREGRSMYNKIYQLNADILGQKATLSVTSVCGHLMEHVFPPDMKNWNLVPVRSLFDAPIYSSIPERMKDIATTLTEESAKCDVLVIWTDCDREGESIGAEIAKVCLKSNQRLDVYRARFSEITPRAIEYAARHLTRLDQNMIDAPKNCNVVIFGKQVVSYGSCQFPTLGFVVERYKSIEKFVAESYWKLVVEHKRQNMKAEFSWDRVRLFDRDIVQILYDDCMEARGGKIESVSSKPKTNYRPQPLDTVKFEKLAVRKLKISAKKAMDIAERLYNRGYISYPRTETNKFASDIDLSSLVRQLATSPDWGDFASEVLEYGPNPRNGTKSDEAHPPIHPLKQVSGDSLQGDDRRVYDLIARHFLACLSWDAKGQETHVRVYIYDKWSDKILPTYVEGEELIDFQLRIADGQTQPPELLNEADLIALMDKYGIGTDSTHAEHIEKIKTRMYVGVREDGRFIPGFLGLALVLDEQLEKYRRIFLQTEMKIGLLSEMLQNLKFYEVMCHSF
ncbi:unnamed protein product [Angiostrongylus costaricensis]|uniref:DNA topoisomerase n=1 Tax=Angiostrongylus costaricensis TaxID=334426 RepID=A0A158PLI1_ANGCS|nr:unnamed protein product [Angiostrongylus costaricensis]